MSPFHPLALIATLLCAAAALTGCSGGDSDAETTASETAPETSAPPPPPLSSVPPNAESLGVLVRRTGGMAGSNEEANFNEAGQVAVTNKAKKSVMCTVDAAFADQLGKAAESKGSTTSPQAKNQDELVTLVKYHGKFVRAEKLGTDVENKLTAILDGAAAGTIKDGSACP